MKQMGQAFHPSILPIDSELIKTDIFLDELIDASTSLEVYKEKIKDSKLDRAWFLPTLQQKEALASLREVHIQKKEPKGAFFNTYR